jgi:hypothetical protein
MNNFFLKQTFNAQANLLASSDLISGLEGLMSIIFAFDHALTEMGFFCKCVPFGFHSS